MIRAKNLSRVLSAVLLSATLLQTATAAAQWSNVPFPSRGEPERGGERDRGPGRGDDRDRGPGRGPGRGDDHDRGPGRGPGRSEIDRQKARQLARLLYRAILFREGEQTGVQGYAEVIEREGLRGLNSVAAAMADSPEFRRQVERNYRPRDIAQNLYSVLLGRSMDPSGRDTYVPMIRQGRAAEAVRGIISSSEFRRRHLL